MSVSEGNIVQDKGVLSNLIKQRGIIKGRLTKFSEYITTTQSLKEIPPVKYKELDLKLNKCQSLLNDYEAIQDKIDLLHTDSNEQIKERDGLENQFLSLISICQELLDNRPNKGQGDRNPGDDFSSCHSHTSNSIKLPTIKLPTFDGSYLHWLEFKDTFESVINSNEGIPQINKFHYLRSSLEGSASVVIKSIEFSAKNYKIAWDLLCERFDNKNILINNHLKALFNIEPLRTESFKALRFIVDHVSKHLRALESLGQPTDKWDALIIFMISAKLDINTSRKWEEYKCNLSDLPLLSEFHSFLRSRADVLETAYCNNNRFDKSADNKPRPSVQSKSFVMSYEKKERIRCVLCNDCHHLYECPKFKLMDVDDRVSESSRLKLCKNCLRSGHNSYQCKLKGMCLTCKKKHNTLLHKTFSSPEETQPSTLSSLPVAMTSATLTGQVLLCTALVKIVVNNKTYPARALLDTGSQSSFVTERLKEKIGLSTDSSHSVNVYGINDVVCNVSQNCIIKLKSRVMTYEIDVRCLVVPRITGILPSSAIDTEYLKLPNNIELADPNYFSPAEVDILLGADVFWDIVGTNLIRLGTNKPVLQESKLGWLVGGPLIISQSISEVHCNFSQEIKDSLEKFWKIDDLPQTKTYSIEEQLCENHFLKNVSRLPCGRFSVQMPMKEVPEKALGDSYFIAKKCLESLERKFIKFPTLKENYKDFIKEYAQLGHLTKINRPEFGYYMPHHAVIREKSETTKLRVVFNASSKTQSGKSLNDIQLVGPVVQSDLISILFRFRLYKYILTEDIEKTPPKDLKMFVCNRVNEINELTGGFTFLHVPTDQNPADMASRGVSPKQLHSSSLWWGGPSFLVNDPSGWPKVYNTPTYLPEVKNPIECHVAATNNIPKFDNFSNLNKLKRVYGYVLRFINNCKNKDSKVTGPLEADELDRSLLILIKHSQSESFSEEIKLIASNKPLNRKSKLVSLNCFIDLYGLLRAGGRIQNSDFEYDKKHPIILDAKHHLTKLLFRYEHDRLFHAGPQHLLASIRERFWPIGGRHLARSTAKQCMICFRLRGQTLQPLMGNLPAERSNASFPFYSCGVDFAGPFMISSRKGKGNRISKCYLCLFICLASKAIHLELVSDLSTEAFILSLRRFVSRRGKPHSIFCDNGSNFKGAYNEMSRILRSSRESISDFASNEGFKFVFSPAYSPHFGGIWEAGVKSAKHHLRRVAGNASLTFEELATLFTQIEAILNSRPLTPLSSDPSDPSPLTPGHFLIGRPLTSVPSLPITSKHPNRYQLIEQLRQHFWDRWRREFVAELQQRTKWRTKQRELQVGDLVILKEENLPPLQWRLARISRLYPGVDGISRVADILTTKGIIRRGIHKFCVIPTDEDAKMAATEEELTPDHPNKTETEPEVATDSLKAEQAFKAPEDVRAQH